MGVRAALLAHLLERVVVDGNAVDLEALVVRRGRQAWTLFLDVTVLNHDGNLDDVAVHLHDWSCL
jgi:exosome complex RNA-binding protein Rrp42 (RNase PH superfamily)